VVYFSAILGYFILEQLKPMIQDGGNVETPVFTDNPEF
jgi:hypothetical protein